MDGMMGTNSARTARHDVQPRDPDATTCAAAREPHDSAGCGLSRTARARVVQCDCKPAVCLLVHEAAALIGCVVSVSHSCVYYELSMRNGEEAFLASSAIGAALGAYVGALPIPLDWDRPWQVRQSCWLAGWLALGRLSFSQVAWRSP